MRLLARFFRAEPEHLKAGRWGEDQAARFLRAKGWRVLARGLRIGRRDELDLVARAGPVLVFVEVKTRRTEDFGRPLAAVGAAKRRNLARAARAYLRRVREKPEYFRFDVVEVIGSPEGAAPVIRHIANAFTMNAAYRWPW